MKVGFYCVGLCLICRIGVAFVIESLWLYGLWLVCGLAVGLVIVRGFVCVELVVSVSGFVSGV